MSGPKNANEFNANVEGIQFLRYEMRSKDIVAVFRLAAPMLDWATGEARLAHEMVLNRTSLETRLSNLQAAGFQAEVTAAALQGWPSSPTDLHDGGLPRQEDQQPTDGQEVISSPEVEARTAPRTRLIVRGKLITSDGPQDCVIVDISTTGAQLSLASFAAAPQMALLQLPNGVEHAIQCKWQRRNLVGYAFLSAPEDSASTVQPSNLERTIFQAQRDHRWRRMSKMLGLAQIEMPVPSRRR